MVTRQNDKDHNTQPQAHNDQAADDDQIELQGIAALSLLFNSQHASGR